MLTPDQSDALITRAIDALFEQWWSGQPHPGAFDKEQCRIAFIAGFKAADDERDRFLTLLVEGLEAERKK